MELCRELEDGEVRLLLHHRPDQVMLLRCHSRRHAATAWRLRYQGAGLALEPLPPVYGGLTDPEQLRGILVRQPAEVECRDHPFAQIHRVRPTPSPPPPRQRTRQSADQISRITATECRFESRVIIESTGASDAFPAFLHALRSRYEVMLISIWAPLERCLERIRSRDQTMHIPASDDRVAEINARSATVRLPWDLQIDNSGPAAAEAILDRIRRLLSLPPPPR